MRSYNIENSYIGKHFGLLISACNHPMLTKRSTAVSNPCVPSAKKSNNGNHPRFDRRSYDDGGVSRREGASIRRHLHQVDYRRETTVTPDTMS